MKVLCSHQVYRVGCLILGFFSAISAPPEHHPITEEVELKTASGSLYGTLSMPQEAQPCPVVLIIAGSGPTDRNGNSDLLPGKNNALKMIADSLAQAGFASLRYDKRGVRASRAAASQEEHLRFEHYVEDAVAWIHQLKKDKRLTKIVVLGHSEGSLIGMLAARKTRTDAFISVAGAAQPADSLILEQLSTQPDFVREEANKIIKELKKGHTVQAVGSGFYALFRPSVQPYLMSWFQYHPAREIARLKQPVLIVQGTTDLQVQVKEAKRLVTVNPKAELVLIEGMNHILKGSSTDTQENIASYSTPDLPLAQGFMPAIIRFLQHYL